MTASSALDLRGAVLYPGFLSPEQQSEILADLREVVRVAPFFVPVTPRGQKMSVRMTAAGAFGWVTDRRGYRYEPLHPGTGAPWPPIPASVLGIWTALCPEARSPECCLVNYYQGAARMGMHQDKDEADFNQPVLSISLGDDALFRIGNDTRGGKTSSVWLRSGDVLVMGGAARQRFHGVDRINPGTSTALAKGGRINLTLRVVT